MKRLIITAALLGSLTLGLAAQENKEIDLGAKVVYALPSTSISVEVETQRETYIPGPYAKYASKYLGINVSTKKEENYSLTAIKLTPYLEADQSTRTLFDFREVPSLAKDVFFNLNSQGLLMFADQYKGTQEHWRFPQIVDNVQLLSGATDNFASVQTTLYKSVKNEEGLYDRVAIPQTQVVEKSLESKAKEAASLIFELRENRLQIITGDTDATFSGESLGDAVATIDRLEAEYMTLFLGKREYSTQTKNFEVLPQEREGRQLYIAFRMSETQGALLSDDLSGRPIIIEITPDSREAEIVVAPQVEGKKKKDIIVHKLYYRIPNTCSVKVLDGAEVLLQSRMPIYQLGETVSYPIIENLK